MLPQRSSHAAPSCRAVAYETSALRQAIYVINAGARASDVRHEEGTALRAEMARFFARHGAAAVFALCRLMRQQNTIRMPTRTARRDEAMFSILCAAFRFFRASAAKCPQRYRRHDARAS